MIRAALRSILPSRPFVLQQIFPEGSVGFGELGSGWVGVYRWCRQSAARGEGRLRNDLLVFQNFDLVLLHLDADVAAASYADGSIPHHPADGQLPCERPCPPPSDSTNPLRSVLLSWCGETTVPERVVLCMPSKNTEAWVVAALFPNDPAVSEGIECYPNPEARLGQQKKSVRIRKKLRDYQVKAGEIEQAWRTLAAAEALDTAHRFQSEFQQAVLGLKQSH